MTGGGALQTARSEGRPARRPSLPRPAAALLIGLAFLVAAAPARAEAVVAVAAPLSGPHAEEGRAIVEAVRWASEALNADGGIDREPVAVIAEDDGCDEQRAVVAAAAIAQRKPALVVGHPCGAAASAAARVYAARNILLVATAPRHPDLTRRRAGPTIFRLAGRDDTQGAATARYLISAYTGRRIAIVHDRTRYARGLVDAVKTALAANGVVPVPEFGIVASSKDFGATVAGLRAHRAEVVYFAGFPAEAVAIWSQLRNSGLAPDLVGSDALVNAEAEIRPIAADGHVAVRVVRPASAADTPAGGVLRARLTASGHVASPAAIAAYAAVEVWSGAVRAAAGRESVAVAARLSGPPLPTVAGPMAFDDGGDAAVPSYAIARIDGEALKAEAVILPESGFGGGRPGRTASVAEGRAQAPSRGAKRPHGAHDLPPLPARHPLRRARPGT